MIFASSLLYIELKSLSRCLANYDSWHTSNTLNNMIRNLVDYIRIREQLIVDITLIISALRPYILCINLYYVTSRERERERSGRVPYELVPLDLKSTLKREVLHMKLLWMLLPRIGYEHYSNVLKRSGNSK